MIAITAGFFLVAYLLAPGAIYRAIFSISIPSKRFQRSRTDEIVFSVVATAIPFAVTWLLLCLTPLGRHPQINSPVTKRQAYKEIFNSLAVDGAHLTVNPSVAYLRAFKEQCRFIATLWLFCGVEALAAVWLVRHYGDYAKGSRRRTLCEKCLLVHVSEWQLLFTTLTLPSANRRKSVEVDVLTTYDTLYRGKLTDWFTESDGKLAGLFLADAERYRRDKLARDRESGVIKGVETYWKTIPGSNMYLPAGTIANYNIRYVENETEAVRKELGEDVTVEPLPPLNDPQ